MSLPSILACVRAPRAAAGALGDMSLLAEQLRLAATYPLRVSAPRRAAPARPASFRYYRSGAGREDIAADIYDPEIVVAR